jgi:hypothetical protein
MKALFRACANAWSTTGAQNLDVLVSSVDTSGQRTTPQDNVPAALKQDYVNAVASLSNFPDLQREMLRIGSRLPWMQGTMKMPDSFKDRFAYVELAGPRGMIANSDISFGLYLQQRDTVYPNHWHSAMEDYLVVSGTARWQVGDKEFVAHAPGAHIAHASNQPHATTTQQDPLLALWFWQGDIRDSTYRVVGVDV